MAKTTLRKQKKSKKWAWTIITFLAVSLILLLYTIRQPQTYRQHAAVAPADIDHVVTQVLNDLNTNGWDTKNNGILINWRRDDLSKVNCSSTACDTRGNTTRHDSQNDFRTLENLYWYKFRHPGNTSMDQYIANLAPTVKSKWGKTHLSKGWVYFTLLRMAKYSGDSSWNTTAQNWATKVSSEIDPNLGVIHGPITASTAQGALTLQDAYRVDQALEIGAALVDAGKRFNNPQWSASGQKMADTIIQQSYSQTYHLFNRIYVISDPVAGSNRVYDYQAKLGEQGQELEALINAGLYTKNTGFITIAKQMIQALQTQPIHDKTKGGYFAKMYLGPYQGHVGGETDTNNKEGGRQLQVLGSIHLANVAFNDQWAALEDELLQLAITPGKAYLGTPVPGFTYQQEANWAPYPCSACSPNPTENWNSAEADNIALEALQTVLLTTA